MLHKAGQELACPFDAGICVGASCGLYVKISGDQGACSDALRAHHEAPEGARNVGECKVYGADDLKLCGYMHMGPCALAGCSLWVQGEGNKGLCGFVVLALADSQRESSETQTLTKEQVKQAVAELYEREYHPELERQAAEKRQRVAEAAQHQTDLKDQKARKAEARRRRAENIVANRKKREEEKQRRQETHEAEKKKQKERQAAKSTHLRSHEIKRRQEERRLTRKEN